MKKSKFRVIGLMLIIFSTGCTADVYLANTHNIPMLEEKGDMRLSGGLNFIGTQNNRGLGGNAAYAITDKLGIGGGAFLLNHKMQLNHWMTA